MKAEVMWRGVFGEEGRLCMCFAAYFLEHCSACRFLPLFPVEVEEHKRTIVGLGRAKETALAELAERYML